MGPEARKCCGVKCTQEWTPWALVLLLPCILPTGSATTGLLRAADPFCLPTVSGVAPLVAGGPAPQALCLPLGCHGEWTPDQGSTPEAPISWHGRSSVVLCPRMGEGGQQSGSKQNCPDTPEPSPAKASWGAFAFLEGGGGVSLDLLLVSRRPGQKVGGTDSAEASLPGYCVTWGRPLSFSNLFPH